MWRRFLVCVAACALAGSAGAARGQSPKVALTFDDLPETSNVPPGTTRSRIASDLIRELKQADVPPVYGFINAGTLDDPAVRGVLEHWRAAGYLLGNHTFTHFNLNDKPLSVFETDIRRDEPELRKLMAGKDWHWFRYPFLSEGVTLAKRDGLRDYLKQRGYRIAEVTINFDDDAWNDPYARCVARRDIASVAQMKTMYLDAAAEAIRFSQTRSQQLFHRDINYIVLLHLGGFAPVMLPQLMDLFQQRGFTLVTLPDAESDPVYQMDPKTANDGGTFLDDLMEASALQDGPHTATPTKVLAGMCRGAARH